MYELTVTVEFSAAHFISGYPGACSNLHGHNWQVDVTVQGAECNELGMVLDFRSLKDEVNTVINLFDHKLLNDLPIFQGLNPTSENIASCFYNLLASSSVFSGTVTVKSVRVWESLRSSVLYQP